jgi:hypothetical protein
VATISSPADRTTFRRGDEIRLEGFVVDEEDGTIPCDDLRWDVRLGHNSHSHPTAELQGCTPTFRAGLGGHDPGNEVYYVVELRYSDRGAPGAASLTGRAQIRLDPVE